MSTEEEKPPAPSADEQATKRKAAARAGSDLIKFVKSEQDKPNAPELIAAKVAELRPAIEGFNDSETTAKMINDRVHNIDDDAVRLATVRQIEGDSSFTLVKAQGLVEAAETEMKAVARFAETSAEGDASKVADAVGRVRPKVEAAYLKKSEKRGTTAAEKIDGLVAGDLKIGDDTVGIKDNDMSTAVRQIRGGNGHYTLDRAKNERLAAEKEAKTGEAVRGLLRTAEETPKLTTTIRMGITSAETDIDAAYPEHLAGAKVAGPVLDGVKDPDTKASVAGQLAGDVRLTYERAQENRIGAERIAAKAAAAEENKPKPIESAGNQAFSVSTVKVEAPADRAAKETVVEEQPSI